MIEWIVFGICIVGCGYQSFQIGVREGAERTVTKLAQEKIISIKLNGEIIPNKFFKP